MAYPHIRRISAVLVVVFTFALAPGAFAEEQHRINKGADDVAILGYDTVAYFTEGRPVKGSPDFEYVWQDARWQFSKPEHRDLFSADPDRYAPRYGGFCSGGMTLGWIAPIDPEAWVIVDDRLYLNYSKEGRDDFAKDPAPEIAKADENWKRLGKPQ
jgi:hypothetical protein